MSDRFNFEDTMDVLTDVLNALELKGWLSSRTEMTTSWRFAFAESSDMIFHILQCGRGYLSCSFLMDMPISSMITPPHL